MPRGTQKLRRTISDSQSKTLHHRDTEEQRRTENCLFLIPAVGTSWRKTFSVSVFSLFLCASVVKGLEAAADRIHFLADGHWEFVDGIPQHDARHGRGVQLQELQQALLVSFARLAQPRAHGHLHEFVGIAYEKGADSKGILDVVLPDEIPGADDRRSPLPRVPRFRELVERGARSAR